MLHMRHSNQSGFTIVELMVTTFVMFIVVVVFGGIISASYRQAIAADALASMTRDMHVTISKWMFWLQSRLPLLLEGVI